MIPHTAYAEPIQHARPESVGLQLLVKQGFDETVAAVAVAFDPAKRGAPGTKAVEAIVLAAHSRRPMVVVSANGEIPL